MTSRNIRFSRSLLQCIRSALWSEARSRREVFRPFQCLKCLVSPYFGLANYEGSYYLHVFALNKFLSPHISHSFCFYLLYCAAECNSHSHIFLWKWFVRFRVCNQNHVVLPLLFLRYTSVSKRCLSWMFTRCSSKLLVLSPHFFYQHLRIQACE